MFGASLSAEGQAMDQMRHVYPIAGFLLWIALGSRPAGAQYTANFQTNIISGVTSNWSGSYFVGGIADALVVENGGVLNDGGATVGNSFVATGDSVLVTGTGSVWSNNNRVFIGASGSGNSLVISNGGYVLALIDGAFVGENSGSNSNRVLVTDSGSVWDIRQNFMLGQNGDNSSLVISNGGMVAVGESSFIGSAASSSNNNVLVTGSGSVWSNALSLDVGASGGANSVVISNGGQVVDSTGYVGENSGSSNNAVRVVDGGVWQNNAVYVGYQGSSNVLEVAGGSVGATNLTVGFSSALCNNLLQLDSGSVIVTNAAHTATLEVRHGALILDGGMLQTDTLVMTNSCAFFVHTSGTLIVGSVVLDPNTFRITSITPQGDDLLITWMMGPGATNALQVTSGGADGSYNTNGFSDIFIVTNNTTVGTVTNYLDIGAATNLPARYYRARLAP